MVFMAEIFEHAIHRFLNEKGGRSSKEKIYEALGNDARRRKIIDEKLSMMERFGLIIVDGEEVKIKKEPSASPRS